MSESFVRASLDASHHPPTHKPAHGFGVICCWAVLVCLSSVVVGFVFVVFSCFSVLLVVLYLSARV